MAKIFPSDWKSLDAHGALGRQVETLRLLAGALPARYTVYHGVHWTRVAAGGSAFDSIDFVVVSPAGRIVLIEQKVGFLEETEHGLIKLQGGHPQRVSVALGRAIATLHARLAAAFGATSFKLEELLFCPDYLVRDKAIAGVAPSRIVDARNKDELIRVLLQVAPSDEPLLSAQPKLHRFFSDLLELVPDIAALRERAGEWVTRLSEGLATWGMALEVDPQRVRVIGTAGSGKTQLALRVMQAAQAHNQRVLYVCYNRPLADHIEAIAPASAHVLTYHQLCDRTLQAAGHAADFSSADVFQQFEERFAALPLPRDAPYDVMIIDEGQDFAPAWVAPLMRHVTHRGAVWWLEDPLQNLYHRTPVVLPGFAVLRAPTNFRSPRDVVAMLKALFEEAIPMVAGSPFESSGIVLTSYADVAHLKDETKRAITQALQAGFTRSDIAVVSYHGRDRSLLGQNESLGPHRLRNFTGQYDLLGNPVYQEGEVLFESLYRFKGQAAPCVILTEVDFEQFDDSAARKIFVAATRASMKLFIVASTRAAAELVQRAPQLAIQDSGAGAMARLNQPSL